MYVPVNLFYSRCQQCLFIRRRAGIHRVEHIVLFRVAGCHCHCHHSPCHPVADVQHHIRRLYLGGGEFHLVDGSKPVPVRCQSVGIRIIRVVRFEPVCRPGHLTLLQNGFQIFLQRLPVHFRGRFEELKLVCKICRVRPVGIEIRLLGNHGQISHLRVFRRYAVHHAGFRHLLYLNAYARCMCRCSLAYCKFRLSLAVSDGHLGLAYPFLSVSVHIE